MLLSHRAIEATRIGASLATSAILHRCYRIHAVDNRAVVSEDALMLRAFERRGHVGRPCATIVLEGTARISAHDRTEWLDGPRAMLMDFKAAIVMRQQGHRYRSLVFEWDVPSMGGRPEPFVDVSDPSLFMHAEALWNALRSTRDSRAHATLRAWVADTLAALRAAGAPIAPLATDALEEPIDPQIETLSRALDRALSAMDDQPMIVDLTDTLGLSARQLQRIVTAFHEQYGFNSRSWQDTRSRRRVMMGATLMTVEGATTEYVARVVGYRSPQSFARALQRAGLPAPAQIRAAVQRFDRTATHVPTR